MLSLLSSLSPSQPLMLFVNTVGFPALPSVSTGIWTIQSIAVLHTNMVSNLLLNSIPFAPKGGTPLGGFSLLGKRLPPVGGFPGVPGTMGSLAQTDAVAGPAPHIEPPFGEKVQMTPRNESEK